MSVIYLQGEFSSVSCCSAEPVAVERINNETIINLWQLSQVAASELKLDYLFCAQDRRPTDEMGR